MRVVEFKVFRQKCLVLWKKVRHLWMEHNKTQGHLFISVAPEWVAKSPHTLCSYPLSLSLCEINMDLRLPLIPL